MSTTKEWKQAPIRERVIAAEAELCRVDDALRQARLDFEVAARTYAVLRDMFKEHFGESPYQGSWAVDQKFVYGMEGEEQVANYGMFRFTFKSIGAAVVEVLQERGPTESIDEILLC